MFISSCRAFSQRSPPPPPPVCLDLAGSDSCVCRGGFPSHRHGAVRLPRLVLCEEELAVRHLRHRRLHQLHDHHVSQRGRCRLARLHGTSNKPFMKHLFGVLFQEMSHPRARRALCFCFSESLVCLSALGS